MNRKSVAITGANRGIGLETARQLGRQGYRVWLGSRDGARGEAAARKLAGDGQDVRAIVLDVTSDDSVRTAADFIERQDGKLDVLINNAGVSGGMDWTPSTQPVDAVRDVYETNVFAPIRVTQTFLPLLKAAGRANVVMISSGLGSLGLLSDPSHPYFIVNHMGYNSSKSALNAVTVALSKELAACGINVNAADPGYTATDFNNHTGYRTVEQAAAGIVWLASQDASGPTGGFFFEQTRLPW